MYEDMMNGHTRFLRKYLWKLKVPLKIKVFMWFLNRKVLLTKDNLARRKWQGCTKCSFCGSEETMEYLFISCPFAIIVWCIVYNTYNITPSANITNMKYVVIGWTKTKAQIRIGVSALFCLIWNCRNNLVFEQETFMFCRWPIWLSTGFSYGRFSYLRTSEILWLLDVHGS